MLEAAVAGAVAGYAIAIPVGAIAVLIIQTGFRYGAAHGFAAAAGAATADGIYATIAALAGLAATSLIGPLIVPLRVGGGLVLVAIGVRGLLALFTRRKAPIADARADAETPEWVPSGRSRGRTYLQFLGLTLLNPATVVYFAALTVGLPFLGGPAERISFVAAAFAASFSWQVLLAAFGSTMGRGAGRRLQTPTMIVGNVIIIGFGALILLEGLGGNLPG